MEKITFKRQELLENLFIYEEGDKVKLINNKVKILLTIDNYEKKVGLFGFYKQEGEERKGITRCALLFLLQELIDKGVIAEDFTINVISPSPSDGNMERLIKIYNQIGFLLHDPIPGTKINLVSTIAVVVAILSDQCQWS